MKTLLLSLLTIPGLFSLTTTNTQTRINENTAVLRPQLTAFSAVETSKTVSLNWATSSEKNSSHFIVERSGNGLQFDSVGAVTAVGRFDLPTSYEFTDLQPLEGSKYYRLRIVDLDGTRNQWSILKAEPYKEMSALR